MAAADRVKQAQLKAANYCARGEKSPKQVLEKLESYGLDPDEASFVLKQLISENFVDRKRFAKAFANDKFRFNKWGKIRIRMELIQHKITSDIIDQGLDYISDDDYREMIDELLMSKIKKLKGEKNHLILRKKAMTFVVSKGFEPGLVGARLTEILK